MAARVCKNGVVVASWTRQFSSKRTNDLVCLLVHEIRWLNYVCWMDGGMRLLCDTCLSKSSSGFVVQPLVFFSVFSTWSRACVCAEICCGTKTYKNHGQCSDAGIVCRG